MAVRPSSVPQRVVLPEPPASSLPHVPDPESDLACTASPTVTRLLATIVTNPEFESTAAFALVTELVDFAARSRLDCAASLVTETVSVLRPSVVSLPLAGDLHALDIPTPRSYAEAVAGEYSSQWQTAMDAKIASWNSISTYVDEVPPPGADIVDGMWIFIRQGVDFFHTSSPTPKMTSLRVLLHVAAQRNYEPHSSDFSTAFLQCSLYEEIWLRRPPGFTGSFPAGTQWSLRRPVYGLRQAPCEWHDTLRTTIAALGFAPSSANMSLFLRTDTTLPPFYVLVYVDDLVFATADTEALALVKAELQQRHTYTNLGEQRSYLGLQSTRDRARRTITLTHSHMVHQVLQRFGFQFSSPQPTPLSTGHSLSAPPSDESIEPSGPYPELVGCLITSGMGLVLGGRGSVVLTGHSDASWADDQATERSCEAEIYVGAMAAHELRWLIYLLTDLGERLRSPPVMYVDNKAMLALCHEQRLEHRTKRIPLCYFLARELQQRRQLRLSYVASRANIVDVFTKALGSGDHQLGRNEARGARKGGRVVAVVEVAEVEPRVAVVAAPEKEEALEDVMDRRAHRLEVLPLAVVREGSSSNHSSSSHIRDSTSSSNTRCRSKFRSEDPHSSGVRSSTGAPRSSSPLCRVFLGFPTDTPPWPFYHPASRRVLFSQDVTFDKSVCFYYLHQDVSSLLSPPPLFLVPGPSPVDPLPPQGPALSGVSQVDPPPLVEPLEVSSDTSSPAEGGDPAADDTAATHRSPRLETPPGFPPWPSSPPPRSL
ncbi:unnamed protein product [Closterium sp. NIES-53]